MLMIVCTDRSIPYYYTRVHKYLARVFSTALDAADQSLLTAPNHIR